MSNNNVEIRFLKEKIEKLKEEMPNLIIPTMGIIEEEKIIKIDNKDYIKNDVKEED